MSRNQYSRISGYSPTSSSKLREVPVWIWGILGISLGMKLAFLSLNGGEYSDGIIQLELWRSPVVFFPPGYTAAVWGMHAIVNDLLLAGRLVSILASIGSLWMTYWLARIIFDHEREAIWATLFLALSPLLNQWSLRVMTDSLFLFMFLICCYQYFSLLNQPQRSPVGFLGWIGLAVLVRYQGLFFLPFAMYLLWHRRKWFWETGLLRQALLWMISLLPWIGVIGWISIRGFGHTQQFIERGSYGFWTTLSLYFSMFETFILYWPWTVTYGIFVCGLVGIVQLWHGKDHNRVFLYFFLIAALIFLLVQSAFLSFQYRYLLPLLPLWCIAAARGWCRLRAGMPNRKLRSIMESFVILNLVAISIAVLFLQRATFADLVDSAKFLQSAKFQRMVPHPTRILSDEVYREGVYNVKMRFWSGESNRFFYYPMTEPQIGDVVILHNAYSDLTREKQKLEEKFHLVILQTWLSDSIFGNYTTLPLFPDIMVNPNALPLTSNPPCMAFRFVPQYYYSVALLLASQN